MMFRYPYLLIVSVLLAGACGAGGVSAHAQAPESEPGQTLKDIQRKALDRQLRDLTNDIRQRDERLQKLEGNLQSLRRDKKDASPGADARYNAKIDRLKAERDRLHRANQLDTLERNRLRGKR